MKYLPGVLAFSFGLLCTTAPAMAQSAAPLSDKSTPLSDSAALKTIADQILLHGQCYEDLRVLTKKIGHRLSGSPESKKAIKWGRKALEEAGADKVWEQPAMVTHWVRGREWLQIQFRGSKYDSVEVLSLGNTEGTKGQELERPVVMVTDLDSFADMPESAVKDKIVFFNYRFRQDIVNTFQGYGDAVRYRGRKALGLASKKGAAAVIIRSISTGVDDVPHAGVSGYGDAVSKIPAMAIGNESADKLEAAVLKNKKHSVMARLSSEATLKKDVKSANVIGEIKGKDDSVIVVSGHLDSWDVGEGAQDDGAGCVQAIEVIRAFKQLGIQPRHTIRAVLYMNEENGSGGNQAYLDSVKAGKEPHLLAIESDAGGFSPRGIGLDMDQAHKDAIRSWAPLFLPYGVYDFTSDESGVDISPLKELNVPLAGLVPDSQRYFDLHHSRNDVFEAVSSRELKLGAFTMAALVYLVDRNW